MMTKQNNDATNPEKREITLETSTPTTGLPPSVFGMTWDKSVANGKEKSLEEYATNTPTFAPSVLRVLFSERIARNILSQTGHNQSPITSVALSTKPVPIRPSPEAKVERQTALNKWENERRSTNIEMPLSSATSTSSTTATALTIATTTTRKIKRDNAKKEYQVETAAGMTEEERILERNRKGRERSLRTRQRNAIQLKALEENVVYLTTENSLLRDVIKHLRSVYGEDMYGRSPLINVDNHPDVAQGIIMAFTALMLCVQSRPVPYIPRPVRATASRRTVGDGAGKVPSPKQQMTSQAEVDLPVSSPTTPLESHILSPFPDDFGLSVEELRMAPVLNIDELDMLLREHDNPKKTM